MAPSPTPNPARISRRWAGVWVGAWNGGLKHILLVERIAEDAKGLRVIAAIDNPDGGAGMALRQGKASGLSFG